MTLSQPEGLTTSVRETWGPILSGNAAERALEIAHDIAAWLRQPPEHWKPDPTLGYGHAGFALYLAYRSRSCNGIAPEEGRVAELLEGSIAMISESRSLPELIGGFPGVAWTIEHLRRHGLDFGEDDPNESIDEALETSLRESPSPRHWSWHFDLTLGLAGVGVYALERMPRPGARRLLESIVHRLSELSDSTPAGIAWRSEPELLPAKARDRTPEGCYNLGVAHGLPGVIAFLGQVCGAGVAVDEARRLLDGAVSWMFAQRFSPDQGGYFPAWVAPNGTPPARRVAWCYGNPGLAIALLVAARHVKDARWEEEAIRIALDSARCVDPEESQVVESCLCHGSAGNGHLFNRLFHATGDERFLEAARIWFERTFEFRRPGQGVAGFKSRGYLPDGSEGWVDDPGFLNGAVGIGLALMAATSSVEPEWDRLIMASIPRT